jgi:hypothetical protein
MNSYHLKNIRNLIKQKKTKEVKLNTWLENNDYLKFYQNNIKTTLINN